jgi:hypothetical protein
MISDVLHLKLLGRNVIIKTSQKYLKFSPHRSPLPTGEREGVRRIKMLEGNSQI